MNKNNFPFCIILVTLFVISFPSYCYSQITLTTPPTFLFKKEGFVNSDLFGSSLNPIADINGDGTEDLLVAAPGVIFSVFSFAAPIPQCSTASYSAVLSGVDMSVLRIHCTEPGQTGQPFETARLDDIDADGLDDYAISSVPNHTTSLPKNGFVNLYSASSGQLIRTIPGTIQSFSGMVESTFGYQLESISDVSGDGIKDLWISDANSSPAIGTVASSFGNICIVDPTTGVLIQTIYNPQTSPLTGFGSKLSQIKDRTGDGIPELAVNASIAQFAGAFVYIFSSAAPNFPLIATLTDPTPTTYSDFGLSIIDIHDVSGDGIPELLIGDTSSSSAYIMNSVTNQVLSTFTFPNTYVKFGTALGQIDDLDADGIKEFIITGPSILNTVSSIVNIYSGINGAVIQSITGPGGFGNSLNVDTDYSGDGYKDILIGKVHGIGSKGEIHIYSAIPTYPSFVSILGSSCNASLGQVVNIGSPKIGSNGIISLQGAPANVSGLLVLGPITFTPISLSPTCSTNLDILNLSSSFAIPIVTDATGSMTTSISIPSQFNLEGQQFAMQIYLDYGNGNYYLSETYQLVLGY